MSEILSRIHSPADLHQLSEVELQQLAQEMRDELVRVLSIRPAHFASNLGVVELCLALHLTFDFSKDRLIWDTSHQIYPHKLITGRFKDFHTIRTRGGLMGYPNPHESIYDLFMTGHAGCSLSCSLGLKVGDELLGRTDQRCVAVIGDGALPSGIVFEALNNAGGLGKNLLVILNDNKMSICPRVGGLARCLDKARLTNLYQDSKRHLQSFLSRVPLVGEMAHQAIHQVKDGLKAFFTGGMLFEELGFRYIGPVDGHDLTSLRDWLESLKDQKGPVLLHVVTKKGKGYAPAEQDAGTFHGVGTFDPETGATSKGGKKTYTQVFGEAAIEIAEKLDHVVAVTAAMTDNTGLKGFSKKFPHRFFDVGMAEEHGVTFSAGLAAAGMIPLTTIYSTFIQRAIDQIIHDVAVQDLHVVFCLDRGGLVGEDGAPQHGAFDITFMRMIPGLVVMAPKNGEELRDMLWTAVHHRGGPISVRYPRANIPEEALPAREPRLIPIGQSEQLRAGGDVALLALGTMVLPALQAAETLQSEGISATVVNARFASPLDERAILGLARSVGRLITVEENVPMGGFGSAVHELLDRHGLSTTPLFRIALPELFVPHGKRDELLQKVGLDAPGIARRALEWVRVSQRQYT